VIASFQCIIEHIKYVQQPCHISMVNKIIEWWIGMELKFNNIIIGSPKKFTLKPIQ